MNPLGTIALVLGFAMAGCAGSPLVTGLPGPTPPPDTVPSAIRRPPPLDLQLRDVRKDPAAHGGSRVRWGGTILSVAEDQDTARITVLERKLDGYGQPERGSVSDGRFVVQTQDPIEPARYTAGRGITVAGSVQGGVKSSGGKRPSTAPPVIEATQLHLWDDTDDWDYAPLARRYYGYYRPYPYGYCCPRYYCDGYRPGNYGYVPYFHYGFHDGRRHGFHFGFYH